MEITIQEYLMQARLAAELFGRVLQLTVRVQELEQQLAEHDGQPSSGND